MKKVLIIFTVIISMFFSSCDELLEGTESLLNDGNLSELDITNGLKKALEVGTDTATNLLSALDGYYRGNPISAYIQLPDEVESIRRVIESNTTVNTLSENIGLYDKFDDIILGINRSAEEAAKSAAPIFKDAILNLTLVDVTNILNGIVPGQSTKSTQDFDSTAATQYFKTQTTQSLTSLFAPEINKALNKNLVLEQSTNDLWNTFISKYSQLLNAINSNPFTSSLDEQLGLPAAVNTDLGDYSTKVALEYLFEYVGKEEKKIRKNPFQWGIDILEKVFGSILGGNTEDTNK